MEQIAKGNLLAEFGHGVGLLLDGVRTLRRQSELWGLAAIPLALSLLSVSATALTVWLNAAELHELVAGWLPQFEIGAWYTWLWLGPARLAR